MTASFASPHPEHDESRLDQAIDRGYDPHPDDMRPPATHLLPAVGVDALTAFGTWARSLHIVGPFTRCAHPTCRTTVTEDTVAYCPHDLPFCGDCVFEDGCDSCANGAPSYCKEAS